MQDEDYESFSSDSRLDPRSGKFTSIIKSNILQKRNDPKTTVGEGKRMFNRVHFALPSVELRSVRKLKICGKKRNSETELTVNRRSLIESDRLYYVKETNGSIGNSCMLIERDTSV